MANSLGGTSMVRAPFMQMGKGIVQTFKEGDEVWYRGPRMHPARRAVVLSVMHCGYTLRVYGEPNLHTVSKDSVWARTRESETPLETID